MHPSRFASFTLGLVVALALVAPQAGARPRHARAHHGPPKHDHSYTRETTHTGPKGGVTTRSAAGSYDADTRTWTQDVTTTRPNGRASSKHVTRTVTPVTREAAPAE
jgi:hypothetical protein